MPCFEVVHRKVSCKNPPDDVIGNEKGNCCDSNEVGSVGKEALCSKLAQVFDEPNCWSNDEQENKRFCIKRFRTIIVAWELAQTHGPSINTNKTCSQLMDYMQTSTHDQYPNVAFNPAVSVNNLISGAHN